MMTLPSEFSNREQQLSSLRVQEVENFLMSVPKVFKREYAMELFYLATDVHVHTYLSINLHIIQVVRRSSFTQNWSSKCFIFFAEFK